MTIRAIETVWKGYRFRSRLEARWAVFFNRVGLKWEYEPEGFDVDGVAYLPDFRVMTPQGSVCWYEIKPSYITSDRKFSSFSNAMSERDGGSSRIALLSGDPLENTYPYKMCPRCGFIAKPEYGTDYVSSENSVYFGCVPCDFETPFGGGHPFERGLFNVPYAPHKGSLIVPLDWMGFFNSCVHEIAEQARASRFEHGEVPA
jgi:hypothetical protein